MVAVLKDRSPRHWRAERGVALVMAFFVVLMLLGIVTALSFDTWAENHNVSRTEAEAKNLLAAESGIALGEKVVWNDYLTALGGAPGLMPTYLAYIDGIVPNTNTDVTLPGPQFPLGVNGDTGTIVDSVRIRRQDMVTGNGSLLRLTAVGTDRFGQQSTIQEVIRVQGGSGGLDYAILARDMSCVFCHTEVDNVQRVANTDSGNYGTYARVKVASLHSTMLRPSSGQYAYNNDTQIAGTFYTRGHVLNADAGGAPMTAAAMQASSLDGYQFDTGTELIDQTPTGNVIDVNLVDAVPGGDGTLPSGENLYMDYPTGVTDQTDGFLPVAVQPLFDDANGNRFVDAAEVQARMADVAADYGVRRSGSISGGVIHTVPYGGQYGSSTLPSLGNTGAIDSASGGVFEGNVILVGTAADPLVINQTVVIDGDVVIQGVVEGFGQIYASGNIYVPGDIEYPQTHDWSAEVNGLVLKAGGNIMISDFLTPQRLFRTDPSFAWLGPGAGAGVADDPTVVDGGDHRTDGDFSFTAMQMALFNRLEWQRTQPMLPDQFGNPVPNSTYDPAYVPRYQAMGPDDPVYIFAQRYVDAAGDWAGSYWDNAAGIWRGAEEPLDYVVHEDRNYNGILDAGEDTDSDGVLDAGELVMLERAHVAAQGGSVIQLTPNARDANGNYHTGGAVAWISDRNLKGFWIDDHDNRPSGRPITINAGLETDGTIFALARNERRYGRKYRGQITVNGMLVANNIGLLSPGDPYYGVTTGLRVHYDQRLQQFDGGDGSFTPVHFRVLARQYLN